ncbi:MAG: SUMF1/EgtB/PvdO family nonheme iron enzyme [Rikenellaceae bacterium]
MKKLLLLMPILFGALISCGGDDDPTTPVKPAKEKITVSPTSVDVAKDFAGTKEIAVTSKVAWKLTGLPTTTWLKADVESGKGDGKVVLTFIANATDNANTATLIFTNDDGNTAEVAVKQAGADIPKPDGKLKFVNVEGGDFLMGDPNAENNKGNEPRPVTLSSFRISTCEITQAQYEAAVGNNPSILVKGDLYPVTDVTWDDAIEFCNKLSEKEGLTPAYGVGPSLVAGSNGYRIPTEAQFEFAAIGGKNTQGLWYPGSDEVSEVCVAAIKGDEPIEKGELAEVGTKKPNELGLFDMGGNCWEWVWDYYEEVCTTTGTDPFGPESGDDHAMRGGAFDSYWYACSVYGRYNTNQGWDDLSFRVVLPAEGKTWVK